MERYVSEPIPYPVAEAEGEYYSQADLIFYEVNPTGDSYYGLVFLNAPDADHTTPVEENDHFAGWFTVFGHGGCFGDDESHCAPSPPQALGAEFRVPLGIPRQTKTVTITEPLRRLASGDSFTVTVVAVVPGDDGQRARNVLEFGGLRLVTYV
jgi:tyrosinase